MKWYLYLALKQLFPSGRYISLFFIVSNIGVMLGVAVLLIVQSIMNGLGAEIRDKMANTDGHVRIHGSGIIYDTEPLIEIAKSLPEVEAVAPYAEGLAMMMGNSIPQFPFIKGIDVFEDDPVVPLQQYLRGDAKVEDLDDERVFLSIGLARAIGAYPGSTIELYSPLMLEKLKRDEVLLPRELTVAGIFQTGYNEVDSNSMVITLRLMQELYGLHDGSHGISLRLKNRDDAEAVALKLNEMLDSPYYATTWLDTNQARLFILNLEKTVMGFINLFIILIASFSIAVSLFTAVLKKTREIGLIGAIGASSFQIAGIYCFQGFLIGVTGSILGVLLTFGGLAVRGTIMEWIAWAAGDPTILQRFYGFEILPVRYEPIDFTITISLAIIGSTIAGLLPAFRAALLKPADALRNE